MRLCFERLAAAGVEVQAGPGSKLRSTPSSGELEGAHAREAGGQLEAPLCSHTLSKQTLPLLLAEATHCVMRPTEALCQLGDAKVREDLAVRKDL
eukprot:CAMPEP_0170569256 /NCGR_PEP_ID=MMETSP0224-20130122/440_1 /TAXON_ID=285029 /ORGANISM="Togula jolla, Strain CCCM 725" /LENGTH=94 /DNA_ID=CAMNT_0010891375 /DNA_START=1058 /DNA_END=1341 /DNA_ORIENTATION=+